MLVCVSFCLSFSSSPVLMIGFFVFVHSCVSLQLPISSPLYHLCAVFFLLFFWGFFVLTRFGPCRDPWSALCPARLGWGIAGAPILSTRRNMSTGTFPLRAPTRWRNWSGVFLVLSLKILSFCCFLCRTFSVVVSCVVDDDDDPVCCRCLILLSLSFFCRFLFLPFAFSVVVSQSASLFFRLILFLFSFMSQSLSFFSPPTRTPLHACRARRCPLPSSSPPSASPLGPPCGTPSPPRRAPQGLPRVRLALPCRGP